LERRQVQHVPANRHADVHGPVGAAPKGTVGEVLDRKRGVVIDLEERTAFRIGGRILIHVASNTQAIISAARSSSLGSSKEQLPKLSMNSRRARSTSSMVARTPRQEMPF